MTKGKKDFIKLLVSLPVIGFSVAMQYRILNTIGADDTTWLLWYLFFGSCVLSAFICTVIGRED